MSSTVLIEVRKYEYEALLDGLVALRNIVNEIDSSGTGRNHVAGDCPCSYCMARKAIAKYEGR